MARSVPPGLGNGHSNALADVHAQAGGSSAARTATLSKFGFAVPSPDAIAAIQRHARHGVVEVGAGVAYWAMLLSRIGVDVVAYDLHPPPSATNQWFADTMPWHPVECRDIDVLAQHPDRTLLMIWPTKNEDWPADALLAFFEAGGEWLVYIGEGPGGRSGDDRFHSILGSIDRCYPCAYGIDAQCVCDVSRNWRRHLTVEIPTWDGCNDRLELYQALGSAARAGPVNPIPSARRRALEALLRRPRRR